MRREGQALEGVTGLAQDPQQGSRRMGRWGEGWGENKRKGLVPLAGSSGPKEGLRDRSGAKRVGVTLPGGGGGDLRFGKEEGTGSESRLPLQLNGRVQASQTCTVQGACGWRRERLEGSHQHDLIQRQCGG